jgi:hypothetical protein
MSSPLEFLEPWHAVAPEAARSLERELARELTEGHILFARSPKAVAQSQDDVLFTVDGSDEVVVVHLTWSGRTETAPFPWTQPYPSLAEWHATRMAPIVPMGHDARRRAFGRWLDQRRGGGWP